MAEGKTAPRLTHVDGEGRAHMVDVGHKPDTERVAVAKGEVHMQAATLRLIAEHELAKGDVLTTAQLAGIMGAKQTADLIPLCHPLPLTHVDVALEIDRARSSGPARRPCPAQFADSKG
jgi:cyclic pyranopterin phosphate synthase